MKEPCRAVRPMVSDGAEGGRSQGEADRSMGQGRTRTSEAGGRDWYQRTHPGVWTEVLETISVLAVIANGLVIGISSDFIPRLVYKYYYGPCANGSATGIDCMVGYINNTLSIANISDQRVSDDFKQHQMITYSGINVTHCSYRDYRSNEDYSLTNQFWVILAARLVFIIVFEHVVVIFKCVASWFVPASPLDVRNERQFDKLKRLKEELRVQRAQHDTLTNQNENGNVKRTSKQKKSAKLNSM